MGTISHLIEDFLPSFFFVSLRSPASCHCQSFFFVIARVFSFEFACVTSLMHKGLVYIYKKSLNCRARHPPEVRDQVAFL